MFPRAQDRGPTQERSPTPMLMTDLLVGRGERAAHHDRGDTRVPGGDLGDYATPHREAEEANPGHRLADREVDRRLERAPGWDSPVDRTRALAVTGEVEDDEAIAGA